MTTPETTPKSEPGRADPQVLEAWSYLRTMATIVSATLRACSSQCECANCATLRTNADTVASWLDRMAHVERS